MSRKSRFLELFRGGKPTKVPWVADLYYWYVARKKQKQLPEKYSGREGYIALHDELGVMFYYDYDGPTVLEEKMGSVIYTEKTQQGARKEEWVLGDDSLTRNKKYLPQSYCWAITKYPVSDEHDLRVLFDIIENWEYHGCYKEYKSEMKSLNGLGFPAVILPRSPIPSLIVEWTGIQNLSFLMHNHRQFVEKLLDKLQEKYLEAVEVASKSPAPVIHFADNLSAEIIGGFFDDYMADCYTKALEILHGCGKYAAVHIDGTVGHLPEKFAKLGMDALESLTPAPFGDLTFEEIKKQVVHTNTIVWGGLPGALFTKKKKIFEDYLQRLISSWDDTPLIIGIADQLPPDGDISFVSIVSDIIHRKDRKCNS